MISGIIIDLQMNRMEKFNGILPADGWKVYAKLMQIYVNILIYFFLIIHQVIQ